MELKEHKCCGCGSGMFTRLDDNLLKCSYCGNIYSIKNFGKPLNDLFDEESVKSFDVDVVGKSKNLNHNKFDDNKYAYACGYDNSHRCSHAEGYFTVAVGGIHSALGVNDKIVQ